MNKALLLFCACILTVAFDSHSQQDTTEQNQWQELLENVQTDEPSISPDGQHILLLHKSHYQSVEYIAQTQSSLAGLSFYNDLHSRSDSPQIHQVRIFNQTSQLLDLIRPDGVILDFNWSPDSKKIIFLIQKEQQITPWLYDLKHKQLSQISSQTLSARLGARHVRWTPDSNSFIVKLSRGATYVKTENKRQTPNVLSFETQKSQGRTYTNLLDSTDKSEQFKQLTQSHLVRFQLDGQYHVLAKDIMVDHFAVSPNGEYVLVSKLSSNLPTTLPYRKWGREYQVIDLSSLESFSPLKPLANRESAKKAKDWVPSGSRLVQWLPHKDATLSWVEPLDDGDMSRKMNYHEQVYQLSSPFIGSAVPLLPVPWRTHNIVWSKQGNAILQEWRYQDRQARTSFINKRRVITAINQRDYRDKYMPFGDPYLQRTPIGNQVLYQDNDEFFVLSSGQTKQGVKPTVTAFNVNTLANREVFSSPSEIIEQPLQLSHGHILTKNQSASSPISFTFFMANNPAGKQAFYINKAGTHYRNEAKVIHYKRADELAMTGTLHLPNMITWQDNKTVPAVLWIYPQEFKNKKLSQQSTATKNIYRNFNAMSPLVFLQNGIAVFEAPMPITAFDGSEPNDVFLLQIRQNAKAAIAALKSTNKIDTERLALMGHSYGAFTVANLLAHTNLFKAGIARSGAYNRTLTPFGFQGENRHFWQAKETYLAMSPLLYADQIDEPLLLIHGEQDQNSGTYPMQSKRMYQALIANQKPARLIQLPYEGHNYKAKENLLFMLEHQALWLKQWL